MTSKHLFTKVAESIEILLPISQFGWLRASATFLFLRFSRGSPSNGPPDAVKVSFDISD